MEYKGKPVMIVKTRQMDCDGCIFDNGVDCDQNNAFEFESLHGGIDCQSVPFTKYIYKSNNKNNAKN